jgi:hypothetical protein
MPDRGWYSTPTSKGAVHRQRFYTSKRLPDHVVSKCYPCPYPLLVFRVRISASLILSTSAACSSRSLCKSSCAWISSLSCPSCARISLRSVAIAMAYLGAASSFCSVRGDGVVAPTAGRVIGWLGSASSFSIVWRSRRSLSC